MRRVTVGLIGKAEKGLEDVHLATGLNYTDIINRAVQFYAYAEQNEIYVMVDNRLIQIKLL